MGIKSSHALGIFANVRFSLVDIFCRSLALELGHEGNTISVGLQLYMLFITFKYFQLSLPIYGQIPITSIYFSSGTIT